ncbi:MAG: hypothetical protein HQL51_03090 [Magnetococcales bacterium]|nr:hypothetical protein [Magnetococcales bacterium]
MSEHDRDPPPETWPEFLHPKLRLFLSVDVVNSTAFKQDASKGGGDQADEATSEPWFVPITQFYGRIEKYFADYWQRTSHLLRTRKRWQPGEAPEFWKAAGDEVIYQKIISDQHQILTCVLAWKMAVNQYRPELKSKFPKLDLKAAAWLAGFPVNNTEVVLRSRFRGRLEDDCDDDDSVVSNMKCLNTYYSPEPFGRAGLIRDFIGPSMDTGFRVATRATPRKLALTVDLAWMLSSTYRNVSDLVRNDPELTMFFRYDGGIELKGVTAGRPYPFFWIDMEDSEPNKSLHDLEDKLKDQKMPEAQAVQEFCEAFFASQEGGHVMRPFVWNRDSLEDSIDVPERHRKRLRVLAALWNKSRTDTPPDSYGTETLEDPDDTVEALGLMATRHGVNPP